MMGFTSSFDSSSFASFLTILPSAAVDASCSCNELELELESPKDPCTEDSTVVDGAGAVTDGSACEGGALRLLLPLCKCSWCVLPVLVCPLCVLNVFSGALRVFFVR